MSDKRNRHMHVQLTEHVLHHRPACSCLHHWIPLTLGLQICLHCAWNLWIPDELLFLLDKITTWKNWSMFEETQTCGSLIQTQRRAPFPLVHSILWKSHSSQVSPNSLESQDTGSTSFCLLPSLISLVSIVPGAGGRTDQEVIFLIPWGRPEKRLMGTLSPGNTSSWVWLHTLLWADLYSTHSYLCSGTFSPIHEMISLAQRAEN